MSDDDYEIGYKKPPKESQWKPGHSGNPKGRPKKTKDFEKLLDIELSQVISITERGERRSITVREAILKTLISNALKNDLRSLKLLLPFIVRQQVVEGFEPDAADRRALQDMLAQFKQAGEQEEGTEVADG